MISLLIPALIQAQEPLKVGIKAGLNFSLFHIGTTPPTVTNIYQDNGFYAGVDASIPLAEKLYLQPEAYYSEARVQSLSTDIGLITEYLSHVNIPVLIKYKGKHFGTFIGPQISLLMKANSSFNSNVPVDAKDSYESTNISALVGVEYTFKYRFGIEARYQQGFKNIRKEEGKTQLTEPEGQNIRLSGFQTGLFFRFGKKPKK